MKTALEALEMLAKWEHPASNITTKSGRIYPHHVAKNSAATLRLAIEQAEKQEHAERLSLKGWQYFECPACGSEGARAFPQPEQDTARPIYVAEVTMPDPGVGYD